MWIRHSLLLDMQIAYRTAEVFGNGLHLNGKKTILIEKKLNMENGS